MNTLTPICDSEVIHSEPHGYLTVAYCVAQKLEVENAALKQQVAMLRDALKYVHEDLMIRANLNDDNELSIGQGCLYQMNTALAATEPKGEK